jgi:hypothetical protein
MVAEQHPDLFNLSEFTYARFKQAKNLCDSRCFGYSLPTDMIVPFADCANHHIVDMTVEIYNKRLHSNPSECTDDEKHYFQKSRLKFDYKKHQAQEWQEETAVASWTDADVDLPYKARRSAKKVMLRD